jgi:hypothetical protein
LVLLAHISEWFQYDATSCHNLLAGDAKSAEGAAEERLALRVVAAKEMTTGFPL